MTPACLICGKPVPDYVPEFCCQSFDPDCACRAMPLNPCVCGPRCYDALIEGIGTSFENRRLMAGIPLWQPEPGPQ